ncbi:hypothetical protein [Candidatus Nitrospira bockiana]
MTIALLHRAAVAQGMAFSYDELARAVRGSYRPDIQRFIAQQLGQPVEKLWPEAASAA